MCKMVAEIRSIIIAVDGWGISSGHDELATSRWKCFRLHLQLASWLLGNVSISIEHVASKLERGACGSGHNNAKEDEEWRAQVLG